MRTQSEVNKDFRRIMATNEASGEGGIAPNQVIARSEFRGAPSNVYGVNVTKAVIGAYM